MLEAPYPRVENIGPDSFDIVVKPTEQCDVFYVVLADGAPEPLPEDIVAGAGSLEGAADVLACGSGVISDTSVETLIPVIVRPARSRAS
mgnify:CR=1 FL=1